ncbi:MAG: hypothetical protein Q8P84_01895 [Deltaproteobacteria bacterium]|nr:hypothetical protein [Deltaproteobacteria bacterium]
MRQIIICRNRWMTGFLGSLSLSLLCLHGCGSSGVATSSGTTAEGDTTLTTSVTAPVSASVSVGQSLSSPPSSSSLSSSSSFSASKSLSASKSEVQKQISVAKVVTAESAASGAECSCKKGDGTVLGSGTSDASGKVSIKIDSSKVDFTQGVVWDCTVGGKNLKGLCSAAAAVSGGSVSCDAVNTSSTVAWINVLKAAGVDGIGSDFFSKVTGGSINPRAVFRSIFDPLEKVSGSAGDSSMQGMMRAMKDAMSACMANGGSACVQPEVFIGGMLDGKAEYISAAQGFVPGIDFSKAQALVGTGVATMAKTMSDASFVSTGHGKFGDDFFLNQGRFFGNFGVTEVNAKPEVLRGFMEQNFGSAGAFEQAMTNAGAARAVGLMANGFGADSFTGKYDVMSQLIMNSLDNLGSSLSDFAAFQKVATGLGNQMQAIENSTQKELVLNKPGAFAGKIFDAPDSFTGAGATTAFQNQFVNFIQWGSDAFVLRKGCL